MIKVKVDPKAALGWLTDVDQRQFPFAVSLALNRVANLGQAAEREHIKSVFKLRKEVFVLQGVKISKADRANKNSWKVVIQLSYPEDKPFLNIHEPGGERVRYKGGRLWKPNSEVFKSKIIGRANPLHPKNLALRLNGSGRIQGKENTFLVKSKGNVLILQRTARAGSLDKRGPKLSSLTLDNVATGMGPRRKREKALRRVNGIRLLYKLVSKVKIPARLEFHATIARTVNEQWVPTMQAAMQDALRSAR